MPQPKIRAIRIVKGAHVLHVHGALAGQEGVWLGKDQVHGLYDAPVKTTYVSGAFQEGSSHRFTKRMHRDLELGFLVKDATTSWEFNDSVLRRMFDYEIDRWDPDYVPARIEVDTDLSGVRKLDVFMYEDPEFVPDLDSIMQQFGNVIFKLRAPDPMWYEDPQIDSFGGVTASGTGFVTVENPTDNIMYHKWILTPANWALPDYQWLGAEGERAPGGADANRTISDITVTGGNGGITIDLDRSQLMYRDANDTNALAQFGTTRIFLYPIPPHTPATDLPVAFDTAPTGGAMVQLRMILRWSRPWGLEMETSTNAIENVAETVFTTDYTYAIPSFADTIDVVLLSGSGGGDGGHAIPQHAGNPGNFVHTTLVRGTDIPWDTEIITGVIGQGGVRGNIFSNDGTDGTATTATATGMTPLSAAGGTGGGDDDIIGQSPGTLTFNGRNYYGGAKCWILEQSGNAPGGGGSAGFPFGPGGYGARGQAWFYAYRSGS